MKFLIAIEPATDTTAYGVVVPDLPGCFSAGDTLEEAFDNAREAIDAHCEFLAEDGRDVPLPAAMAAHQSNLDYAGWVWAMEDVAVESYWGPAEKVNITLPGRTLRRIDEYARAHGQTRSGFLAEAARQAMR
jgi:predicted RNase H-like HicB family nuclease